MDTGPSDAELVARARLGDKDAFGQLADRYIPMARRLAQRMVARDGRADDVVQEALLQAYLSLRHLKEMERFRGWFYGIVLNVCRAELSALGNDAPAFADLAAWHDRRRGAGAPAPRTGDAARTARARFDRRTDETKVAYNQTQEERHGRCIDCRRD
jgi:RNA polymerase sigma-70 factor (ECF subfamily)